MSESENPVQLSLTAQLQALLFVAAEPVSLGQLALALELPQDEVEAGLRDLEEKMKGGGLRLLRHAGRVQLTSAAEMAELIERFLGLEATSRLSRAALETLAIVAFQQPVTRPQIEAVRGVSSDGVMKSLLSKGLVQENGRAEGPGRPILYGTTPDFLRHFGLASLSDLPSLDLSEAEEQGQGDGILKG